MMNNTTTKIRTNGVANTQSTEQAPSRVQFITREAQQWASFVLEQSSMNPVNVSRKALDAVAFSIESGAKALAIPTKLAGTRDHQEALAALHRLHPIYAHRLEVEISKAGFLVSFTDQVLGRIPAAFVIKWIADHDDA